MKLGIALSLVACVASGTTVTIDLTREVTPPSPCPLEQGTFVNPKGETLTADSRSFFLDAKPWVPIVGEFHYSRMPQTEWRDALLKMKAGGLSVVATYVFWIHHEEIHGHFDWSGQRSLRAFIQLCAEQELKVIVRMGPWCHGEARNGGFPDWVQQSGTKLRTTDPAFMNLVKPFYRETAQQMAGLLWKDGGPVIGIQIENECDNPPYMLALKALARAEGVDVPLYTMTGWNKVRIPSAGLLPMFGAYSDGFWGGTLEDYRKFFVFTPIRDDGDMGAQMNNMRPERNTSFSPFPYACAEIGPGMMSSYTRRIKIQPANIGAMALTKLGCGNNMPGYYMYQGGTHPDGVLSFLQEDHPNALPVKDYDFQTALGACGQVREQYHLLRLQHLFLQDFGTDLARMPAFFPDQTPASLKDVSVLRWSVRTDGQAGFLFFNNRQPAVPLPDHSDVQFALKARSGIVMVPRRPITIPSGCYGLWPVNLNCDGVLLTYATVQPLCRVRDGKDNVTYFFTALAGIKPELVIHTDGGERVIHAKLGTSPSVTMAGATGTRVAFVVLTPQAALHFWRMRFAGRDRALLSRVTVLSDKGDLRLLTTNRLDTALSMFPVGDINWAGTDNGIFKQFASKEPPQPKPLQIVVTPEKPGGPLATSLKGNDETTWNDAAVYKLQIPPEAEGRHLILNLHYIGDAARLYVGNRVINDDFFNGDPFPVALWRIPVKDWPMIRVKILPYSEALAARLPPEALAKIAVAKAAATLDTVTVTPSEILEARFVQP